MKIQLLLPAGEIHRNGTGIFKRELRYAPLTLTTLAALIPDDLNVALVENLLVGEAGNRHAVHLLNVESAVSWGHLAGPI